ncbi:M protein trans-acting positive regulator PRD domain-containing protein [Desemzia sp. FAM 24101]|uniref:M protein trans-acting positive regulator PRD domain-containing protein n=1 Tax=unclassified Desemzia TaxID=2685243 RepID=UPI0038856025
MREILEKYEERKLKLFETLYANEDWMPIPVLAKTLHCSEKTLKQDVLSLKELLAKDYLQTSYRGVCLFLPTNMSIEMVYRLILKESTHFLFLESLFHDETKSLDEMAEFLYISSSTLARTIKKINLVFEDYPLKILTNPCRLEGPESTIRSFYISYFMEKCTHVDWPYPTMDRKIFENFIVLSAKFIHTPLNFSDFERVKHWIAVSLIRTQKGHYMDIKPNNLAKYIPDLTKFRFILKPLENIMNISFQPEFIEQVFAVFLTNSFAFTYDQLIKEAETDPVLKKSIALLSDMLDSLSNQFKVPIPNKEHLLLDLYNLSKIVSRPNKHIRKTPYILFDQKEYFVRSLEKDVPTFIHSATKQIRHYQQEMDLIFSRHSIDELIYTLVIHWNNLLVALHKQRRKAKLLIISTYDLEHAKMLRDLINIQYGGDVVSELYMEPRLSLKLLKNMDYDILISTTSIDYLLDKKVFCIQNIPTEQNLRDLKLAIDVIRKVDTVLLEE